MVQASWGQQQTKRFFESRSSPSQIQCDQLALSISGASKISPVDNPGSLSYTVVCNDCHGPRKDLIVSFREPGGLLDDQMVGLAKKIHGDLVPESVWHGIVEGSDPPLSIYSMPCLRGTALIEVQSVEIEMSSDEEAKHEMLIRHLARYFARCWSNPQSFDLQTQIAQRDRIRNQLTKLMEELPVSTLSKSTLSGLIDRLTSLFNENYPQVLTHGDFSMTNILVNEDNFEITGVVDWSLAAIMPFGMDLDILFLATGFMTLEGWHDYACKLRLLEIFWDEFWAVSGIDGEDHRETLRTSAEAAGKIWAVLRMVFRRNADGSPSDEVMLAETGMEQLRAWLGD